MLLSKEDISHLEMKIASAEQLTSAEFKIIVAKHAWFGLRKKANRLFKKHNLHQTKERNAVLLLVIEKDKQLLIYGDEGIHSKLEPGIWELILEEVISAFKQEEFTYGLGLGIHLIADHLVQHYPSSENMDKNEISNEIIFEN